MTFTVRIGSCSYRAPRSMFDELKTGTIVGSRSSLKANGLKTLKEPMFNFSQPGRQVGWGGVGWGGVVTHIESFFLSKEKMFSMNCRRLIHTREDSLLYCIY